MITVHTSAMSTTRNFVLRMSDLGAIRFSVEIEVANASGGGADIWTGGILLGIGVEGFGICMVCGLERLGVSVVGKVGKLGIGVEGFGIGVVGTGSSVVGCNK